MSKKTLIIMALGWFLCGCAGVSHLPADGEKFGAIGVISLPGCTAYVGPVPVCSGDKKDPIAIINLDADPFELIPKCVKAKKGKRIQFNLISSSPIPEASVVIFPKDPENYRWLARTNSPNANKITIRVPTRKKPSGKFPTGEYHYGIWTKERCLDPRVKVEN